MIHANLARAVFVLALCAACTATALPTAPPASVSGMPTPIPTVTSPPTTTPSPTATPVPTPTPLTTISQKTSIGTVTVEVPSPLIPPGTEIRIQAQPIEDAPREVRDAGIRQAFHVLAPEDLVFAQPIDLSLVMPRTDFLRPDGSLAIAYAAMRRPDGTWDWLASASMTVTSDNVEIAGMATHLGALFVWSDLTNLAAMAPDAGAQLVGQTFRPLLSLKSSVDRPHPVGVIGTPEYLVDNPTVLAVGPPIAGSLSRDLTCSSAGSFAVTVVAQLANFAEDNSFFSSTLQLPATTGSLSYVMTGSCVSATPSPPPTPNSSPSSSP